MNQEIKTAWEKLLKLNSYINELLKNFPSGNFDEFNDKFQNCIQEKNRLINFLQTLKKESPEYFDAEQEFELKELIQRVKTLEQENVNLSIEKKQHLSEEIGRSNKTSKILSAYKFNKQEEPSFFDKKD